LVLFSKAESDIYIHLIKTFNLICSFLSLLVPPLSMVFTFSMMCIELYSLCSLVVVVLMCYSVPDILPSPHGMNQSRICIPVYFVKYIFCYVLFCTFT